MDQTVTMSSFPPPWFDLLKRIEEASSEDKAIIAARYGVANPDDLPKLLVAMMAYAQMKAALTDPTNN